MFCCVCFFFQIESKMITVTYDDKNDTQPHSKKTSQLSGMTKTDKGDDKAYNQLLSCCQYDKTYILIADGLMNAVQVWFLLFLWVI